MRSCTCMKSSGGSSRRAGQRTSSENCNRSASTSSTGGRAACVVKGGAPAARPDRVAADEAPAPVTAEAMITRRTERARES